MAKKILDCEHPEKEVFWIGSKELYENFWCGNCGATKADGRGWLKPGIHEEIRNLYPDLGS